MRKKQEEKKVNLLVEMILMFPQKERVMICFILNLEVKKWITNLKKFNNLINIFFLIISG